MRFTDLDFKIDSTKTTLENITKFVNLRSSKFHEALDFIVVNSLENETLFLVKSLEQLVKIFSFEVLEEYLNIVYPSDAKSWIEAHNFIEENEDYRPILYFTLLVRSSIDSGEIKKMTPIAVLAMLESLKNEVIESYVQNDPQYVGENEFQQAVTSLDNNQMHPAIRQSLLEESSTNQMQILNTEGNRHGLGLINSLIQTIAARVGIES